MVIEYVNKDIRDGGFKHPWKKDGNVPLDDYTESYLRYLSRRDIEKKELSEGNSEKSKE